LQSEHTSVMFSCTGYSNMAFEAAARRRRT
jgi:hypothetical protein